MKNPIYRISLYYSTKDVQHWATIVRRSGRGWKNSFYRRHMLSVPQYMRWHKMLLDSNKLVRRDMQVLGEGLHKPSLYKIPFDVI